MREGPELMELVEATSSPEYLRAWGRALQGLPALPGDAELLERAAELRRKAGLE